MNNFCVRWQYRNILISIGKPAGWKSLNKCENLILKLTSGRFSHLIINGIIPAVFTDITDANKQNNNTSILVLIFVLIDLSLSCCGSYH